MTSAPTGGTGSFTLVQPDSSGLFSAAFYHVSDNGG